MNKKQFGFSLASFVRLIAIIGILAAIALPAYQDYVQRSASVSLSSSFDEPIQSDPSNGFVRRHTGSTGSAPLKITTSEGVNYLVKLEDTYSGNNVVDVFVLGGRTVNVDVPTGNYIIKYASGNNWYGYKHKFGPRTGYSKADRQFNFSYGSGYEITLYKVANGNLSTSNISQSQF